jgi:hypothetical protein
MIRGVTVCQPSGWNLLMSRASDEIPGRFSPEYWMSAKGSYADVAHATLNHGVFRLCGVPIQNPNRNRRAFPSPSPPLCAVEFLQCCFRLECLGLAGEGQCAKHANRRVGAREFRPFAAAVSGEAGCDVSSDAGVRPAVAAHKQIEPPALGHADRLPDVAPPLVRDCSRPF